MPTLRSPEMLAGLQQAVDMILPRIQDRAAEQHRSLIAIAGPPAAGKSTLAAAVVDALNAPRIGPPTAALLSMDGFHYGNGLLSAWGCWSVRVPRRLLTPPVFFTCSSALKRGRRTLPIRCLIEAAN